MNFKNKGRAFVVYQGVWGWKDFPEISIEPNSAESPASYKFVGKPEDAAKVIKAVYEIEEINSQGLIDAYFDCDTMSVVTVVTKESGFIIPTIEFI